MENAAPQKRIRQLLLRVGGNDHNGALLCLHGALCLIDIELHLVQFPQQIVGELQIRLVDLVNEKHYLLFAVKGLSQFAQFDVMGNVVHTFLAELPVIETLNGVIHIQPLLGFGGGLDIPNDQPLTQGFGHGLRQHGLARAWLSLDQKRLFQRDCNIHTGHQLLTGHVFSGSLKSLFFHAVPCTLGSSPQL